MSIVFKTKAGRRNYIKKKAQEQRAWRRKQCIVAACDKIPTHYAYLSKGPTIRTCYLHKVKLVPILQKVFATMRDQELMREFGVDETEELD